MGAEAIRLAHSGEGVSQAPAVGVVGASARAAVMSLARAGYAAWTVDLFADRDLKRIAPCVRCPLAEFPEAIPELADRFPPGPVLYTGGLENYPDVVAELAMRRPLWGNGPDVLRRVDMLGADYEMSDGIWTCGKDGQSVPVNVGTPTVRIASITVGGTQA